MGVSLLTTHLFDKRMRVSNACNTDFRLFMVLGEEMLIHSLALPDRFCNARLVNTLYIPRPIFRPYLKVNTFIFYACKRLIKQAGFIVGF